MDELLHLKIANVLLDHSPPQTLILVTGDGRVGRYGTDFLQQAERTLRRGWSVEVWSWKACLSRKYQQLADTAGGGIRIFELDPYYENITFLKAGTYREGVVAGRSVVKLP